MKEKKSQPKPKEPGSAKTADQRGGANAETYRESKRRKRYAFIQSGGISGKIFVGIALLSLLCLLLSYGADVILEGRMIDEGLDIIDPAFLPWNEVTVPTQRAYLWYTGFYHLGQMALPIIVFLLVRQSLAHNLYLELAAFALGGLGSEYLYDMIFYHKPGTFWEEQNVFITLTILILFLQALRFLRPWRKNQKSMVQILATALTTALFIFFLLIGNVARFNDTTYIFGLALAFLLMPDHVLMQAASMGILGLSRISRSVPAALLFFYNDEEAGSKALVTLPALYILGLLVLYYLVPSLT